MRNLPNILSVSRLIATVLVFILVLVNQPWAFLVATLLFFLASVTDLFDGYLARRMKVVSSIGVFLDLTADKVFVSAILLALIQIALVPAWVGFIIITREFVVAGLRSMAAAKGTVISAGKWGKQKTFITLVALGGILLAKGLGARYLSLFPLMLTFNSQTVHVSDILLLIADVLVLVATLWTIFSGVEYILGARSLFTDPVDAARKEN
ncbi:MAG TPA: CDP-diacylglycerol--glycerol-3-phosphate 3-phosphatidyltransferase [Ktedonobacteraceae bacterium]|jgi:CDP-diacylglycerol--glycerol-3-phosphate 3-phosphatidyltransferase|nr:CDP-diacylglycerol--glycerol-3-phosphate 3-phosphatidyltransferase [Ktedonobacteraceae bacterium]